MADKEIELKLTLEEIGAISQTIHVGTAVMRALSECASDINLQALDIACEKIEHILEME